MFRIEPVTRQRAYYNYRGKRRYKDFRTVEQATDRVAWWMIFEKHGSDSNSKAWSSSPYTLEPPKRIGCACHRNEYEYEWRECPAHDRDDGYFKRLHDRLVRYINSLED